LQRLEHPNIIWLHEIIDDPLKDDYIYLVAEYHSKGSLGDLIKKLNTKYNEHN
jgi:serine/threonine protein kinase